MRVLVVVTAILLAGCPGSVPSQPPDAKQLGFVREWGHMGSADGEFHFPIGIAIVVRSIATPPGSVGPRSTAAAICT